ncbi:MAG TPA: lamin tail domain-containing protein [Candidatus Saccharimonadales bacterium]|nr:lamin tail domain-containing protein [Candidatus Saccharimonadales bacterium]
MKKYFIAAVLVVLCASPAAVLAQTDTHNVLIVELQTGQAAASGNDFVEFYNPNTTDVDVTGWRLQYRAASAEPAASWTTKRSFACPQESPTECKVVLPARGRLVVATYDIPNVDEQRFSGGFAAAGGQIRLALPATQGTAQNLQQDMLGYGTAAVSEGQPSAAPEPGKSLKRTVSEDGYFIDTQNNAVDFIVGCGPPTPGDTQEPLITEPPECEPSDPPDPDPDPTPDPPTPTPVDPVYLPLEITELLPDPTAPLKDDTDEFVEIFNPNTVEVNIEDYALRTGASLQNKITLGSKIIPPGGLAVITSGESSLSLINAGTAVQLVDPVGTLLEEVPNYGSAKPGYSWMKNEHGWHWSSSPTPGAANVLTIPSSPPAKPASAKKGAAIPKKVAAAKTTIPKAPAAPKPEVKPPEQPVAKAQPNYWIIAAIGGMAAAYGAYEYRQELRRWSENAWHWLRKK